MTLRGAKGDHAIRGDEEFARVFRVAQSLALGPVTQSVGEGIPTQSVGTRETAAAQFSPQCGDNLYVGESLGELLLHLILFAAALM